MWDDSKKGRKWLDWMINIGIKEDKRKKQTNLETRRKIKKEKKKERNQNATICKFLSNTSLQFL